MRIALMALMTWAMMAQENPSLVGGRRLLVALEGGGAVVVDPRDGRILARHETGQDAFGAAFSRDGKRAFVTDKKAGTLVEIGGASMEIGRGAQQPAVAPDGRVFVPLSGESAIAVARDGKVLRRIDTGAGTKPHVLSLSPDGKLLWATVQGTDPKMMAIELTAEGEKAAREFRYDLVPRVVCATNSGAWFTAHHSTGLHHIGLGDGKVTTPYLDENGPHSEARKQIEGVAASSDGQVVAFTHEGRRALVVLDKLRKVTEVAPLDGNPYWVTLDPALKVVYVSIPGKELVEAYEIAGGKRLWRAEVGGKAKRMAITEHQ